MHDIKASLRRAELFSTLDDDTLDEVAKIARPRDLSPDEVVFFEGDDGGFAFVVDRGRFEVTKRADSGVDISLRELRVGDIGGLTSMSVDKTRSATLRARDHARLLTIHKTDFLSLLSKRFELAQALIAYLGNKVRSKTRQVATLKGSSSPDPRTKIAFFDAKPYDRKSFDAHLPDHLHVHYLELRLHRSTAILADGFPIVCAFVNDDLGAEVIEQLAAGGAQLIAMRCAGYNNVDLAAAARHGISLVRVPAYSPYAVAEHAVALILALNRKVHRAHNRVREGNFTLAGLVGFDLHGRTAGIIGIGQIGRCLARILKGFGMRVLAHDTVADQTLAKELGVEFVPLAELLHASDIVSLHVPLTPDTHHLIDAERIGLMKPGVMLINTSRGGLIDSTALISALKTGHISAAGLDVYEEESDYFFEDHSDAVITDDLLARLMSFNNVLITSHQAFLTEEALENIATTTVGSIEQFLAGRRGTDLENAVLPPR